jgi:HAD superfamily hydrolase (TIGR01459 family)
MPARRVHWEIVCVRLIQSLDAILDGYDALLCDVWGVIHNGRRIFPAAAQALTRARGAGKRVILLTNVPKPRGPIPAQLDRLGFPRAAYDGIVTSGDAIRAELAKRAPGPMFKIGPAHDRVLWEGLGLEFASLEQASFIGISGLNDDAETPADYAAMLQAARARGLDLLCANPDIVVRVGEQLIWCAGAIARDYEALGGNVIMAGKPHAPIYQLAYAELGQEFDKSRILAIGDGAGTDMLGANAQGLDCLFVASGMHGAALLSESALDLGKVTAALDSAGARASYVMAELG